MGEPWKEGKTCFEGNKVALLDQTQDRLTTTTPPHILSQTSKQILQSMCMDNSSIGLLHCLCPYPKIEQFLLGIQLAQQTARPVLTQASADKSSPVLKLSMVRATDD